MQRLEKGQYPPALLKTVNGNFIVDGKNWIPVSITATFDEMAVIYEESTKKKLVLKLKGNVTERQWEIKSSSEENKIYIVRLWTWGGWTCDCLGFMYRRTCKHTDKCKIMIGEVA